MVDYYAWGDSFGPDGGAWGASFGNGDPPVTATSGLTLFAGLTGVNALTPFTGLTGLRGITRYAGTPGTGPTITSDGGGATATVNVAPGTTTVTTVTATGTAPVTFMISGGSDASLFQIDAADGTLTFITAAVGGDYSVVVAAVNQAGVDTQIITVSVFLGPLDLVPGAVVAYGQRALSVAMLGTALYTIKRSSDDATQSFSSDALTGDAPSSDISAFIGAGTGSPTIWNDQSGNGLNLKERIGQPLPTWAANQQNGKPGFVGSTANPSPQLLTDDPLSFPDGKYTVFVVTKGGADFHVSFDTNDYVDVSITPNSTNNWLDAFVDASGNEAGGRFPNSVSASSFAIWDGAWQFGASSMDANNAALTRTSNFDNGGSLEAISDRLNMFFADVNRTVAGVVLEVIAYSSIKSDADRLLIRQNIAAYYGITLA